MLSCSSSSPNVWIIRIGDGKNFYNSIKHSIWGLTKQWIGTINKFNSGDILCFITSKSSGGCIVGMGEFVNSYNRIDEPLVQINTKLNSELG